jgi:hypothetical protein
MAIFQQLPAPALTSFSPSVSTTAMKAFVSTLAVLGVVLLVAATPASPPLDATSCEILQRPSSFNGKVVRLKGVVNAGFEYLGLSDAGCGGIWIDYADERGVVPRPNFTLVRNGKFTEFERLLSANKSATATLIGRLDGVDEVKQWTHVRHKRTAKDGTVSAVISSGSNGFGHMGQYKARIVLEEVVEVRATPILPQLRRQFPL